MLLLRGPVLGQGVTGRSRGHYKSDWLSSMLYSRQRSTSTVTQLQGGTHAQILGLARGNSGVGDCGVVWLVFEQARADNDL